MEEKATKYRKKEENRTLKLQMSQDEIFEEKPDLLSSTYLDQVQ
jgi:hypothetical protein